MFGPRLPLLAPKVELPQLGPLRRRRYVLCHVAVGDERVAFARLSSRRRQHHRLQPRRRHLLHLAAHGKHVH